MFYRKSILITWIDISGYHLISKHTPRWLSLNYALRSKDQSKNQPGGLRGFYLGVTKVNLSFFDESPTNVSDFTYNYKIKNNHFLKVTRRSLLFDFKKFLDFFWSGLPRRPVPPTPAAPLEPFLEHFLTSSFFGNQLKMQYDLWPHNN